MTEANQQPHSDLAESPQEAPKKESEDKSKLWQIPVSMPAQVTSQVELNQIISQHQLWIQTVLNPKETLGQGRANLKGADISGLDLSGVDLRGANLSGVVAKNANLYRANLNGANLCGADFSGADLRLASIKRARLDHICLTGAQLDGSDLFEADDSQGQSMETEQTKEDESFSQCDNDELPKLEPDHPSLE